MAATYVHYITIKTNDVREPKYKTIVIESNDTNEEMYEKVMSLLSFEASVSTSFHLSVNTTVKTNKRTPEQIYQEYIEAWGKGFNR